MTLQKFLIKSIESGLVLSANLLWPVVQTVNRVVPGNNIKPDWAPKKIQKTKEKTKPILGWPRETDSLCPECVKEVRRDILSGAKDVDVLRNEKPAEIKARIVEENGKLIMRKTCPKHGTFEDVLSLDINFTKRMEQLFPGRDFEMEAGDLRKHGSSSIRYSRGSVMTIDLTNRCNMMCTPCFTDANQVGFVHELELENVKKILDDSLAVKPRRQMSIQYSGGEPTISPIFIDAIKYARKIGYFSVQCATNGIRFAQDANFAREAADAGLRIAYLQFDGVGNEANSHRRIKNLFDVKLQAIENLYAAGVEVVLVVTVVNTLNNDQVPKIVQFAIDNADKICFVAFQPVSFTGRDEEIDDETRARQRYTLAHLAQDVNRKLGLPVEEYNNWFPLSAGSSFADIADVLKGSNAAWGTMKCSCHPQCGSSTAVIINKTTKEWAPMPSVINVDRLMSDLPKIVDGAHGRFLTSLQTAVSLVRNYRPWTAPGNLHLGKMLKKFDKQSGGGLGGHLGAIDDKNRRQDEWMMLFFAGMWFQDLWTYDFRRTEMCVIPYGTQMGEISFCAHNTGIGWRQIIEQKLANMSTREWFEKKGRHTIYARPDKDVPLPATGQPVKLRIRQDDGTLVTVDSRDIPATPKNSNGNGNGHKDNGNGNGKGQYVPMNLSGSAMPTRQSLDPSIQVNSGSSCCH